MMAKAIGVQHLGSISACLPDMRYLSWLLAARNPAVIPKIP